MQAASLRQQEGEDPLVSVSNEVPRRLNAFQQQVLARLTPLFPNGALLLRQSWTYGESFRVPKLSSTGAFGNLTCLGGKMVDATMLHRIMSNHHEMRDELEELFAVIALENNLSVN